MKENILILGFGATGRACYIAAQRLEWIAFIVVPKLPADFDPSISFFLESEITEEIINRFSILLRSPGIPFTNPIIKLAQKMNIKVWSEIELAWAINPTGHWIGITGSNGKTTTATITTKLLLTHFKDVRLVGNIGKSLVNEVFSTNTNSILVIEMSSFQLENTYSCHPEISVITNLSPNHLDHVPSLEYYYQSKLRIYSRQTKGDICIINGMDSEAVDRVHPDCTLKKIGIPGQGDYWLNEGRIFAEQQPLFSLNNPWLLLPHNQINTMMAVAIALSMGVEVKKITAELEKIQPIPHRMEEIIARNGIMFINDSKSTTPSATFTARTSFPKEVHCHILIGGRNKGLNFSILKDLDNTSWYTFGELKNQIADYLPEAMTFSYIKEALIHINQVAKKGEIVLFSPGCASYDQFANFEERGEYFTKLVRESFDDKTEQ